MAETNAEETLPTYNEINEISPPDYTSHSDLVSAEQGISGSTDVPPTYESIFGQIKSARNQHGTGPTFLAATAKILVAAVSGVICIIMVGAMLALPIAQLVIGIHRKEMCTVNDKIPLFLTVSGACGVAACLMAMFEMICCKKEENEPGNPCWKFISEVMHMFLFAWFICGNVWVYSIVHDVKYDDPLSDMYCDKVTYLLAFWSLTAVYAIIGVTCVFTCCAACVLMCVTN